MRDRLIELINKASDEYPTVPLINACRPTFNNFLADYLRVNGVIVPPCKVGDTVYFIQDKKIYEGVVVLIRPFIHKDNTTFHGNVQYECEDLFYCDGRTMTHQISVVFQEYGQNQIAYLTREEAEKALAERAEDNE